MIKLRFWNFVENPDNNEEVELRIEGEIVSDDDAWFYEWFGIPATTPNAFREALAEHEGKSITVWIDSWGGDVFAAAGIYNALKEHKGKVIVKVDGKAVSAGSVIAMAGDEVLMSPVSIMMIHNPWLWAVGEEKDMLHAADVLKEVKETIINAYQIKSKRSRNKISQMMDEETWMSARKAVAEGFADDILYMEGGTTPGAQDSFMFSRMAVQNSLASSVRRFMKQYGHKLAEIKQRGNLVPKNGVVPDDVSREKAPEDEEWEAPTLSDFTDQSWEELSDDEKRRIAGHYAWAAAMPPESFGDLNLPHHRASDGAVVWRGVANAAARLDQSDIPEADKEDVRSHLGSHYRQFDKTPPWEDKQTANIGLLSLLHCKTQVNKNRIRRYEK